MMKILLLTLLSFSFAILSFGQGRTTPYDFPVKPGSAEWKKLKSGKEMSEVSKIPGFVLVTLTTEALAKTCLHYPLLHEILLASNLQKGIDGVIKNFNGLSELLKRKDAGRELLKIYKNKSAKNLNRGLSETQQGLFTFEFTYLELILSQPAILNNLTSKERIELTKEAIIKFDNKKETPDVFGEFGLTTSAFVIAKVLHAENKLSEVLQSVSQKEMDMFLSTCLYSNPIIIQAIYNAGKSL